MRIAEYILHVGAIGFVPNVQKAIDVLSLVQIDMNIFVVEQHLLSDGLPLFLIIFKTLKGGVIVEWKWERGSYIPMGRALIGYDPSPTKLWRAHVLRWI